MKQWLILLYFGRLSLLNNSYGRNYEQTMAALESQGNKVGQSSVPEAPYEFTPAMLQVTNSTTQGTNLHG